MELFPDGQHVRLRSRVRGMYLHADEDGVGVYLSPVRASLHAAWQVHHVDRDGHGFVLLHNAAYGRYLAATHEKGPRGHVGHRVVQGVYGFPEQDSVVWHPVKVPAAGDDQVLLRHISNRALRANGRFCRWFTGVTVDDHLHRSTMMLWAVEAIPPRSEPPELPPATPPTPQRGFCNLILRRRQPVVEQRTIRFVQADDDGSFDDQYGWRQIEYDGRSVYNLREAVAQELGEGIAAGIRLCVRAGFLGRLTPLVIDLPRNEETIEFVVLSTWADFPGLQYPDVDA